MRLRRKKVVHATLMLAASGVMVEALDHHLFQDASPGLGSHYEEVEPPRGAAAVAVQFTHTVGESFSNLGVFRLAYYSPGSPQTVWEAYLAPVHDELKLRAVPVGPETLTRDQRRVLATLLSGSDSTAWEASADFRRQLEDRR